MRASMRIAVGLLAIVMLAGSAFGVEPAYKGDFGNPEEPAMRPYKWAWRGLKALVWQTGKAFKDGNEAFPIVGSVYAFRGMRVGIVELERSYWRGMCGANNRSVTYKETGKANDVIENDVLLRNVADGATAIGVTGMLAGSPGRLEAAALARDVVSVPGSAVKAGAVIYGGQKVLDRSTPVPEWKPVKEWGKNEETQSAKKAQKRYIGKRAEVNNKRAKGKGNFLKGARKS